MSNPLSVRRVKFQDINEDGSPDGEATYGVIASDSYASGFVNLYDSLAELNAAIEEAGCIIAVIPDHDKMWDSADFEKIGMENFYGKNWTIDDDEEPKEEDKEDA